MQADDSRQETSTAAPTCDAIERYFAEHGGTAFDYLRPHWHRFSTTERQLREHRPLAPGSAILDVGAHWLHQSALYALAGHEVHALDLADTLALPEVRSAADGLGIRLLVNDDLARLPALREVPDDRFDLILFTEVIEHITFNPVAMWRELYRVLKPGGRILVTTPNYYALRGRLWAPRRFLARRGGGLRVRDILELHTLAHHWKEYSLRELVEYFRILSPDFICDRVIAVEQTERRQRASLKHRVALMIERCMPILRPSLYLEVELRSKQHGITVDPHW